ncbi:MAG: transposase, partial [Candidatus Riflemargulisbacteria bacterium]
MSIRTYRQPFFPDSLTFQMAKESGKIYTKALLNNKQGIKISDNKKIMPKYVKNAKYLQSQSAQASYESYFIALESYFKSLKSFKKNPKKFSGEPKPPRKSKFLYKITFKKTSIRRKGGELWLSAKRPNEPIKIKWAENLPIPTWAIISYDKFEGWNINLVIETLDIINPITLDSSKAMSIDLGVKRVATTFNTVDSKVKTYNGKELMSLVRLRNIVDGRIKSKKSKYKKGSRKHRKIARAGRRIIKRIKNKQKNILHKYSSMIVKDCIAKNIGTIFIGDNSSTHNETNTGKENQKIQQNPEQQLAKYVEYKFKNVGGAALAVPEPYTSRDCPKCDNRKSASPKGRIYTCDIIDIDMCNFTYDRDGVGSINIMKRNISSVNVSFNQRWLDVVGGLTPPM